MSDWSSNRYGQQRPPPGQVPQRGYGDPYQQPQQGYDPRRQQSQQPPNYGGGNQNTGGGNQYYSEKSPHAGVSLELQKVADKTLQTKLIYHNLCAVSPLDFPVPRNAPPPPKNGPHLYVLLQGNQLRGEYVVNAQRIDGFPQGHISLSDPQRTWAKIANNDVLVGKVYDPFANGDQVYLGSLDIEISFASANKKTETPYDEEELSKKFLEYYQDQVLSPSGRLLMDIRNIPLLAVVKTASLINLGQPKGSGKQVARESHVRGILTNETRVTFHASGELEIKPSMTSANSNAILAPDFKFEDMGIGGLGDEFSTIFRRAFASRVFPPGLVARMGIPHVKGMLLYGPPGTGKTLIARQIGKMLNAREPKVINGPEVLNKYVGQSEENIRKLFADAEKEYKEKKELSGLHIIIFDELDAVCKQRGSGAGGGTGVGDSVVNQLLSKLDGVDQLNNILLIGMTNRKDMIDDALLRPGRLEVHLEISLPDEPGRLEILKIHTNQMRTNNLLNPDVDLEDLAGQTKNYSGAELNGLVKAAASFAFSRHTEVGQLAAVKEDVVNMKVNMSDFKNAVREVRPAYGVSEAQLEEATLPGIYDYSNHINITIDEMKRVINMIKDDPNKFSTSVLFHGPRGSGKTALAAHIAKDSEFPFVKMISPSDLVGYRDEFAKKDYIHKAFADAYKSPASILILDDFERLIGWNPIGPRFSNTMLEALTTLLVSKPPKGHRLLIFATTSRASMLQLLEIDNDFAKKVAVPAVANSEELGKLLKNSKYVNPNEVDAVVIPKIEEITRTKSVGLGVKTVLDCVFEARAAGGQYWSEALVNLLAEKIQERSL